MDGPVIEWGLREIYEMIDNFKRDGAWHKIASEQGQEFCSEYTVLPYHKTNFLSKPEERISELFQVIRCLQRGRDPKPLNSIQDWDE